MLRISSSFGLVAAAALGLLHCAGEEAINLDTAIPCSETTPCGDNATCLVDTCIADSSLGEGESCNHSLQCADGFICNDFVCATGCLDIYFQDNCLDGDWCSPVEDLLILTDDGEVAAGECTPSECDPSQEEMCAADVACVAITATVGACLPYCRYSYVADQYFDTCADGADSDLGCQPLGLNRVPVCLPEGGVTAPDINRPGCDALSNPCSVGAICVSVVCRELCTPGQLDPCANGQRCSALAQRTDVSFCEDE